MKETSFLFLTHFIPLVSFYTPKKISDFLMISGDIERNQGHEMGYYDLLIAFGL